MAPPLTLIIYKKKGTPIIEVTVPIGVSKGNDIYLLIKSHNPKKKAPPINEYGIMYKIFKNKHNNIVKTGTKTVLTSCIGCEIALNLFSAGKYRVFDFTDFIAASTK